MARRTKRIDFSNLPDIVNDIFYPLIWNESRYLILWGGAGSGKSVFVAQKLIYRVTSEAGHRILCARKVARTSRESTFALIRGIISQWGLSKLFRVNRSDMTITFIPNGSMFIFCGVDDVEKLKSIYDITSEWLEEASEFEENDFTQLDLRLRGETAHYKQIIISFNPILESHWLNTHFFKNTVKNCLAVHSTYKDNRFIDAEYKAVLEAMKDTNPGYYKVYCLGEWGLFEGAYFSMWDKSLHVVEPFKIPDGWIKFRSMDWGSARPYCVGWYAVDFDSNLWKYRELYGYGGKPNTGTKERAVDVGFKIASLERNEKISYGVLDPACWIKTGSSGPSIAEDINNAMSEKKKTFFIPAENARVQGWEQVKSRLIGDKGKDGQRIPALKVFSTCTHTIRTMPMMIHDKHNPEDMDTTGEDHPSDETRYACQSRPWTPSVTDEDKYKDDDTNKYREKKRPSEWAS